jgi:putative RecB family exonuclease
MPIDHLSKSQISLYLDCSLKYKFQYIDELPKPFKSSGLAFGTSIHSALEWLHKQQLQGNPVSIEKLYKIMEADWYSQKVDTRIEYKNGETWENLFLKAKEILNLYLHEPVKKVVAAEYPFEVPLINTETGEMLDVPLQGIMDLIEEEDTIGEFKTAAKAMDIQSLINNLQLTIYAYAYQRLFSKEAKTLKIISFIKNKTPKIEILETTRGQKDYKRLFYLAREVLNGIRSNIFIPRFSYLCSDCEYAAPCREWNGNFCENEKLIAA